jgi:CDP-glycerol glycerophosphotransferase
MLEYVKFVLMIFLRLLLRVFYFFPITQNKVLFSCHRGKEFSCNPKYIFNYLQEVYGGEFHYIWEIREVGKVIVNHRNVNFFKASSLMYFYYYLTAKIVITNDSIPSYIPLRKKQYFIATTHAGGAYKRTLSDDPSCSNFTLYKLKRFAKEIDICVSSNKAYNEILSRAGFIPKHKLVECGLPRNDVFFSNTSHIAATVRQYYGISPERKIVLYAPTFRGEYTYKKSSLGEADEKLLDISCCLHALTKRFTGEFVFMSRMHRAISQSSFDKMSNCINATDYPDMQELLCAADVLITDYSSSIWDFSLTGKPCFLYAPDLAQYDRERGFYTPIESWPAILAESNEELVQNILNFDEESFAERIKKHHEDLGICETGHASQIIGDKIYDICFGGEIQQ